MNPWTTALKYSIAVVLVLISSFFFPSKRLWIFIGGLAELGIIFTSIYLHRTLAHRAISMVRPVKFVFRFVIWFLTGIKPKEWVAVHRKHHRFTDVAGDPHSPLVKHDGTPYTPGWRGLVEIMFDFAFNYTEEAKNEKTLAKYAKDIDFYKLDFHAGKYWYMYGGVLFSLVHLFMWGEFTFAGIILSALFGATVMTAQGTLYVLMSSTVNGLTHFWGSKPYKKTPAFNLWIFGLLIGGEGLHNNHHEQPGNPKLAHRWYEIDPSWYLIKLLAMLRLLKTKKYRRRKAAPA